jgi:hypothetical protein
MSYDMAGGMHWDNAALVRDDFYVPAIDHDSIELLHSNSINPPCRAHVIEGCKETHKHFNLNYHHKQG